MGKNLFVCFVLVLVFVVASACVIAVVDYSRPSSEYPVEEFQKSVLLDSGGTVSLINIQGDIRIQGWERNEVEVYAEKMMAPMEGKNIRVFRWKDILPEIEIDTFEDHVNIKTLARSLGKEAGVVHYSLRVPRYIQLKDIRTQKGNVVVSDLYGKVQVEVRSGDVEVDNFSGSLSASSGFGSLRAALYDLREGDEIILRTEEGDLEVFLQPDVEMRVEASASGGKIASEFDLGTELSSQEVSAKVGEGGVYLSLRTRKGNIWINKIQEDL